MKILFFLLIQIISVSAALAQHEGHNMPSQTKKARQSQVIYTCVMDPEIKMDKPGNCPKCGMKLVPKKESK